MSIDAFFEVVVEGDGAEFGLVLKEEEVVVALHGVDQFNFEFGVEVRVVAEVSHRAVFVAEDEVAVPLAILVWQVVLLKLVVRELAGFFGETVDAVLAEDVGVLDL